MAVKTRERVIEIPDTAHINADEMAAGHTNGNGHIKSVTRRPNPLETILTRAINALKTRGWTTGRLEDERGVCLVGAIQFGATGSAEAGNRNSTKAIQHVYHFLPKRWKDQVEQDSHIDPEAEKDELYIDHDLGDEDPIKTGYHLLAMYVLMEFNDSKAETRGQVLRLLRRALRAVR